MNGFSRPPAPHRSEYRTQLLGGYRGIALTGISRRHRSRRQSTLRICAGRSRSILPCQSIDLHERAACRHGPDHHRQVCRRHQIAAHRIYRRLALFQLLRSRTQTARGRCARSSPAEPTSWPTFSSAMAKWRSSPPSICAARVPWMTESAIRSELATPTARVAAIGKAGENKVRFATISNEGRHAGRGGVGAVMGSKNLKAIALCGDHATTVADPFGRRPHR